MQTTDRSGKAPVLLVSAPFLFLHKPALGLSLLKAALGTRGIDAEIHYYNLRFAATVGDRAYQLVADGAPSFVLFVGEWIFSSALSKDARRPPQAYLDDVLLDHRYSDGAALDDELLASILDMLKHTESFIDRSVDSILSCEPRLVGFTSTYQQHVCSLAMAKRIKAQSPETFLVMGGANCEGVMGAETLRQFEFLDAVISGEAEHAFPSLVEQFLAGDTPASQRGVYLRADIARRFANHEFESTPVIENLDSLPEVSFEDYFSQYAAVAPKLAEPRTPDVLFETSRGCWFGEKSHCTFCGLNGSRMAYRSKSATRALEELVTLSERHPDSTINVTDNILDMSYFNDFVPMLGALDREFDIFCETKSNLNRAQITALREAGIRSIQPGVESLSNDALKRMRKGVTRLRNIQLLKWCQELGVTPFWGLIWGFPGESPEDLIEMASIFPKLVHLPPPFHCGPLRLDRFSPLYEQAEAFGLRNVRPVPSYTYVYPLEDEAIANLAYYFTHDDAQGVRDASYSSSLLDAVSKWRDNHQESALLSKVKGEELHIWDLRPIADHDHYVFDTATRRLYEACDAASSLRRLARLVNDEGEPCGKNRVEDLLGPLVEHDLVLRDGEQVLSLATPLGRFEPTSQVMSKFFELAVNGARAQV